MTDDASALGAERDREPAEAADDVGEGSGVTPAIRRVEGSGEEAPGDEGAERKVDGDQDHVDGRDGVIPAIRRVDDGGAGAADGRTDSGDGFGPGAEPDDRAEGTAVPEDVAEYARFSKIDGATYDRANEFLRERTYITAREWAMARLCADFRTETGVEMTKIGENLPHLVPFMTDTYSPQAVNQARASFEEKVQKAGATFLYGAMCDFFTAEELDDLMYEVTEVAKFLLEVEGVELTVEEELAAEDRISTVMREVREQSAALRHDEMQCPECGHTIDEHDR